MANKKYPNTVNYYVLSWNGIILGPMTFKEATTIWESCPTPSEILKVVVHADGRVTK